LRLQLEPPTSVSVSAALVLAVPQGQAAGRGGQGRDALPPRPPARDCLDRVVKERLRISVAEPLERSSRTAAGDRFSRKCWRNTDYHELSPCPFATDLL